MSSTDTPVDRVSENAAQTGVPDDPERTEVIEDTERTAVLEDADAPAIADYAILSADLDQEREHAGDETRFTEHYSLRGTVGAGGVGRVLLGFDDRIGREVAIKEMLEGININDPRIRARFVREAQVTGRLEHPGIVPVYELGATATGSPFYVMRFVRGDTMSKALAACKDEQPEKALGKRLQLLDRLIDVCEAMAYAHSKGVIHRDLKPGNVVLGAFGETIILDWGLAKIRADEDASPADAAEIAAAAAAAGPSELTQHGAILGTPAYMAPEQLDPRFGEVNPSTDAFALGCMLYQILVGRTPFRGDMQSIMQRLASPESMPSPRSASVPVPPELAAICEKALAKDQKQRFRNAGEMADELRAYRDGRLVHTYAYSKAELLRRFVARNKVAVIAGAIAVVGIVVGAGLAFDFGIEAHQARLVAEADRDAAVAARHQAESALSDATRISDSDLTRADALAGRIETAAAARGGLPDTPQAAFQFLTGVLPSGLNTTRRSVWVIDGNGLILEDRKPGEIGQHLFREARFRDIPELRQLGGEINGQNAGIGFYQTPAGDGRSSSKRIAAWQTVRTGANKGWKVVVLERWGN